MCKKHISFLSFSFSAGFQSPNIPIAIFHQGDTELNFIIDSGSDSNVIDSNVLPLLKYTKLGQKQTLYGVGGNMQEVEKCSMELTIQGKTFNTEFLVSDLKEPFETCRKQHSIQLHGMIGTKFLRSLNIIMNFKTLEAYSIDDIPGN